MRKDVKTGMLIGTGLCLAAAVWFCVHQQVMEQPRMEELLSQKKYLFTATEELSKQIDLTNNASPIPLEKESSIRIHIVRPGETLSDISRIYYNSTANWKKIYEANKEQLPRGPDTIRTGMKLIIPQP